jgi:hypothetical protein
MNANAWNGPMNGAEGSGPTLARAGVKPQRRIAWMLMWNRGVL